MTRILVSIAGFEDGGGVGGMARSRVVGVASKTWKINSHLKLPEGM